MTRKSGEHLRTSSQKCTSKISWLFYILWLQYFIYRKWCPYMRRKVMKWYWQFIDYMEISSIWENKTVTLSSCSRVNAIARLHHMDFDEMLGEKLDRNTTRMLRAVLKKIMETATYKIAAIQPLISHLSNHPNKTNKRRWKQLKRLGQTRKWPSLGNSYIWIHKCWESSKNVYSSTLGKHWRRAEDQLRMMADRDSWRES